MSDFAQRVLTWFDAHGRHDLPWQCDPSPYRVWVSEIMLQQTQVATVIPYFERFMARFPDLASLAAADVDQVLHLWTGLGYYARARNLHRAAREVLECHEGELPRDLEALQSLPGIGRSTAGAIASLAMSLRAPILDGNVKRVLTRVHAVGGWPERSAVKQELWQLAERLTPVDRVGDYTQAMMDLGATVCTRSRPACGDCPLADRCEARLSDRIADFPGRKPKKTLPVRAVEMFVIRSQEGEVLLEKRPDRGIWGGLYSLPERRIDEQPGSTNWRELSIPAQDGTRLESFRHSFTHYHLDITPVLPETWSLTEGVADSGRWLWYPLDHSREVGLAAPVKKLLATLPDQIRQAR